MIKSVKIDLDCPGYSEKYLESVAFCEEAFLSFSNSTFKNLPFESISISLIVIDDEEMKSINNEYREKDKTTDVLSFPLQENLRSGVYDNLSSDLCLGDILISKDTCQRQAEENNIEYMDEFIHLICHGFLHLSGYDHELSPLEDELMRGLESGLIDQISDIKKGS